MKINNLQWDKLCGTITETYGLGSEILGKRKEVYKKAKARYHKRWVKET
jgi:hypothetical protein